MTCESVQIMKLRSRIAIFILMLALVGCRSTPPSTPLQRIAVSTDEHGFVFAGSKKRFHPWGLNYGNAGRLMEDFWDSEWETLASDFREMKALGANVVRVHLQFGSFMDAPKTPNRAAFEKLDRLLKLAERTGLYLDLTGLACYRTVDVPSWYDALDERARWTAQANFWRVVAAHGANSPAIFCYDLMNEPIVPGEKRKPGEWYSGKPFGGYDFVQFVTLDPAGRKREEIAVTWIETMTRAIREKDASHLITVGMLPWVEGWGHLSGFVPARVAPQLDFISVHIYPSTKKPEEAREALRQCVAGKPVVIEETFPLTCSAAELENFLRASRKTACGWMGHYDGAAVDELDALEREKRLTISQAIMREWLRLFQRLKPEFAP